MVVALLTSKKAHNVVKTSVDLARQSDGDENFGTSPVARVLVRMSCAMSTTIMNVIPVPVKNWIDRRFNNQDIILEDNASFDLVRASVNVVLSGLLIAVGTSLKLPLSTTYVAFMVAMGSSLADRAWGRESAVYRITGVLSVIGGWFITAGAAFTICFIVTLIIYWGGIPAVLAMIALAVYSLVRSHLIYKKKKNKEAMQNQSSSTLAQMKATPNPIEVLNLFRQHSRDELNGVLQFASQTLDLSVNGFMDENLKTLRKAMIRIEEKKEELKQVKRVGTLGVTLLDRDIAIDKGLYYYQSNDFASEIVYSIRRLTEPCKMHIDNNFKPLSYIQKKDLGDILTKVSDYLDRSSHVVNHSLYEESPSLLAESNQLQEELTQLKKEELKRVQTGEGSTKVTMVYLTILHETINVVNFTSNLFEGKP